MPSPTRSHKPISPLPTKRTALRARIQKRTATFKAFEADLEALMYDSSIIHHRALSLQKQQQAFLLARLSDLEGASKALEVDSELNKARTEIKAQQDTLQQRFEDLAEYIHRKKKRETAADATGAGVTSLESMLASLPVNSYGRLEQWGNLPGHGLEADLEAYQRAEVIFRRLMPMVMTSAHEASTIDLEVSLDGLLEMVPTMYRRG